MSDFDPTDTSIQGDTQSTNNSQSGVRRAWDAFTSRPENNAALLQFGLAMLQPRAPGQTGLGQFANAVGQGAEASSRNVEAQQAEDKQASEIENKKSEAESRRITANAYSRQVDNPGGASSGRGASNMIKLQQDFNRWLRSPEDQTGLTSDPIVAALRKQYPDIKTKGDLINNPAALAAARQLFTRSSGNVASDSTDEEVGTAPAPAPAPATPPQSGRPVYQKGTGKLMGYWYPDRGYVPNGQ